MQLRIVHTTGYEYDGAAKASYNEARLTPGTSAEQIVVHTRLDISPTPWAYSYRDYFGTQTTAFEINEPHESLRVTSIATVHTNRPTPAPPSLAWSELLSPDVADAQCEYLACDDLVAPPEDLMLAVKEIAARASRPGNAAREVCALVHEEMTYRPGATDVLTPASVAWELRAGVCQDLAHLVVGSLRSLGIPARYVSGYLHPDKEPQAGVTVKGESHAWVEWWDAGWRGFDPTNDEPVGNRHVAISAGRDYRDVRPLSGIYSGGVTSSMFVDVQITRLS
jgi:transglutaminase-like putative cysteine protease